MANLTFSPGAAAEYRAARDWYARKSRGAAERFLSAAEGVIDQISRQPDRFAWYEAPYREAQIGKFAYTIVYREAGPGEVLVLAVAHTSREPGYWLDRDEPPGS